MSRFDLETRRIRTTLADLSTQYRDGGAQYKYDVRKIIQEMTQALTNLDSAYEVEVQAARAAFQWQIEDLGRKLADAQNKLRYGLDTTQEAGDEGIITVVKKPKSDKYGTTDPWTVASLEELCFKMRHAGGEDGTKVTVLTGEAKAVLPFPEAILNAPEPRGPSKETNRFLADVQDQLPDTSTRWTSDRAIKSQLVMLASGATLFAGWGFWEFIKMVTPL